MVKEAFGRGPQVENVHPNTGEANGRAKLTEAQVARIRSLSTRGYSQRTLAEEFGISKSAVWKILNYETWALDDHL